MGSTPIGHPNPPHEAGAQEATSSASSDRIVSPIVSRPRRTRYVDAEIERAWADLARAKAQADAEMAELEDLVANARRRSRWALLDELSLDELLDYLGDFDIDDWETRARRVRIEQGIRREQDIAAAPTPGQRPKGVPEQAKRRVISTAIGKVDIWYWQPPSGGWLAVYGGPRSLRAGRRRGLATAYAAIKSAGAEARHVYGKPIRSSSPRLRFAVLERDGFACHYCGRKPPAVELHVDHVIPVADGGSNEMDNLVTSCQECNAGKSDRRLG